MKIDKEQQIGITEAGEVAFNLDVFNHLKRANIIITKRLSNGLIEKLIEHKDKCILHLTCTGMGGSKLEPFVPTLDETFNKFSELIDKGFPIEHVVLRIDPIIPTDKGIKTALKVVKKFINTFKIPRIRWSSLDMYKHVIERFNEQMINLPYDTFNAPKTAINKLYEVLNAVCFVNDIKLEACGEYGFKTPCVSQEDLDILGINDIELFGSAEQRKSCGCPANKTELIIGDKPHRCSNKCLYCFWKD